MFVRELPDKAPEQAFVAWEVNFLDGPAFVALMNAVVVVVPEDRVLAAFLPVVVGILDPPGNLSEVGTRSTRIRTTCSPKSRRRSRTTSTSSSPGAIHVCWYRRQQNKNVGGNANTILQRRSERLVLQLAHFHSANGV